MRTPSKVRDLIFERNKGMGGYDEWGMTRAGAAARYHDDWHAMIRGAGTVNSRLGAFGRAGPKPPG